jgi:hypothetical protein
MITLKRAAGVVAVVAILFAARIAPAQTSSADQALHDALELLREKEIELKDQNDPPGVAKLRAARRRIQLLLEEPPESTPAARAPDRPTEQERRRPAVANEPADQTPTLGVPLDDFIDHTERYRGQEITLPLIVRSTSLVGRGRSLRDLVGQTVRFMTFDEAGNRLDLYIDLPRGLEVPNAAFADRLLVTFRSGEGNLARGNRAISIRRPTVAAKPVVD